MEINFFNVMQPLQEHTINVIKTGIQTTCIWILWPE